LQRALAFPGRARQHTGAQEAAADDLDAAAARPVLGEKAFDLPGVADEKDALRRDHVLAGGAAHDLDGKVPQEQQCQQAGSVIEQQPAARVDLRHLADKGDEQQTDEGDVPELKRAPRMGSDAQEMTELIFAAEQVGDHNHRRDDAADPQERWHIARRTIYELMVNDAGHDRQRDDAQHVADDDSDRHRLADEPLTPPQLAVCTGTGNKSVAHFGKRCPLRPPFRCPEGRRTYRSAM